MNKGTLSRRRKHNGSQQGGFTLIEILVSLIILSVGVMGIAAMQMSTYKQLRTSQNMSTAAMLAGDIADRMRANPAAALNNSYNHTKTPANVRDCAALACTSAQLATYDIAQWQQRVTGNNGGDTREPGSLPSGQGTVARIGTTSDFNITVRWDDNLSGSEGSACTALNPDDEQTSADKDCRVTVLSL